MWNVMISVGFCYGSLWRLQGNTLKHYTVFKVFSGDLLNHPGLYSELSITGQKDRFCSVNVCKHCGNTLLSVSAMSLMMLISVGFSYGSHWRLYSNTLEHYTVFTVLQLWLEKSSRFIHIYNIVNSPSLAERRGF